MWLVFFSPSMDLFIYLSIPWVPFPTNQTGEKGRRKIRVAPDARDSA